MQVHASPRLLEVELLCKIGAEADVHMDAGRAHGDLGSLPVIERTVVLNAPKRCGRGVSSDDDRPQTERFQSGLGNGEQVPQIPQTSIDRTADRRPYFNALDMEADLLSGSVANIDS